MKKLVAVAVFGLATVAGATGALAGEVTGTFDDGNDRTPMYTPVSPLSEHTVHASACSFSGLEDGVSMGGPVAKGPGITQTPHYEAGVVLDPGVPAFNPGYNCVGQAPGRTVPGHGPQG